MSILKKVLRQKMRQMGLSTYAVVKASGIPEMSLRRYLAGKRPASDAVLDGLASVQMFGLNREQWYALRLLDEYPPAVVQQAATFLNHSALLEEQD
jgi:transcriptional regulator with XRE-family HTH domain